MRTIIAASSPLLIQGVAAVLELKALDAMPKPQRRCLCCWISVPQAPTVSW